MPQDSLPADEWDVAPPVLFNTWKHHAGAIRREIEAAARGGEPALAALPERMVTVGTELMDLYLGETAPGRLAQLALRHVDGQNLAGAAQELTEPEAFAEWIADGGGYRTFTADDGCVWVLRAGESDGRYVHLHPGRWAPRTRRVRANVMKTAIAALAVAAARGEDALSVALVNDVRAGLLGMSPVKSLDADDGIGLVIRALRGDALPDAVPYAIPEATPEADRGAAPGAEPK